MQWTCRENIIGWFCLLFNPFKFAFDFISFGLIDKSYISARIRLTKQPRPRCLYIQQFNYELKFCNHIVTELTIAQRKREIGNRLGVIDKKRKAILY